MKILDKVLILLFFLYIIWIIIFLWIKYYIYKSNYSWENIEIKEVIIKDEIFYPYNNKTLNKIKEQNELFLNFIKDIKNNFIEYNNIISNNDRNKIIYSDFFSKYKTQISYINFLIEKWVPLTNFEKKSILLFFNNIDSKTMKWIESQDEFSFILSNNTLIWKNKRFTYNKETEIIRIQEKNKNLDWENEWVNIFVWKLILNNIKNEYVYNIWVIDNWEKNTYIILYSINKDWELRNHFLEVQFYLDGIQNIINKFSNNIFSKNLTNYSCNLKYRYVYIDLFENNAKIFCRSWITWNNIEKVILSN